MAVDLRPYQVEAVDRVRARIRERLRRVLMVAPTGAGKTVIAAHIIERAAAKEKRVLFFAHRRELISQAYRKLVDAGIPESSVGVLMGSDPRTRHEAPIQVASIDTWRNRSRPQADLVIVDEAHRSLAQTYLDAINHYAEAGASILGMTATPYRADGGGLGAVYKSIEVVRSPAMLIADGFLVAPRVFSAPEQPDLRGVHTRRGDYVESELAEVMNESRLVGNVVEHYTRLANGIRAVAFSVNIAHSIAIRDAFLAAGIAAEHIDGGTPTGLRDAVLARVDSGETKIVSNCGVLCEGWDQPSVKCAILARPTKSTGLYLQQAGRILRPWQGQGAIILDHAGNALKHGLPQDDRPFTLDENARSIQGAPVKQCPQCGAVLSGSPAECPECHYAFESKKDDDPGVDGPGELVEIDPSTPRLAKATERAAEILGVTLAVSRSGPPTERQVDVLTKSGIKTAGLDKTMASKLIAAIIDRRTKRLCTLKQASALLRNGVINAASLSYEDASSKLNQLAANNWRPNSEF